MADGKFTYDELRFDVRDPDITHVYVAVTADHNCPISVQGWHYKAFPARLNTLEVHEMMFADDDDPIIMWPLKAPPR